MCVISNAQYAKFIKMDVTHQIFVLCRFALHELQFRVQ